MTPPLPTRRSSALRCDVGDGKADLRHQPARGIVAPRGPAGEQPGPKATFRIDGRPVGIACAVLYLHEQRRIVTRAVGGDPRPPDPLAERVGVIEPRDRKGAG